MTFGQYVERTLQDEYRNEHGEDASLLGFLHYIKGRLYRLGWSTVGVSLRGYETPGGGWRVYIGEVTESERVAKYICVEAHVTA